MGFFSDLLKTAAPIVGSFLGLPAPPVTAVARVREPGTKPSITPRLQEKLFGEQIAAREMAAAGGACPTQGALRRRTIVETFDPETGAVCRSETFKGAPAVMQSDVAAANRLNRALRRLNKQQPRKLVKQTTLSRLKEDVIEGALRGAGAPCPNGNGNSNHA